MKYFLLVFLIFINFSFIPEEKEKQFYQDLAIIHGIESGLPKGAVDRIKLNNEMPVVLIQEKSYAWNGDQWVLCKNEKASKIPSIKHLPETAGKILSSVPGLDRLYQ